MLNDFPESLERTFNLSPLDWPDELCCLFYE
jgi:hypothetical protein